MRQGFARHFFFVVVRYGMGRVRGRTRGGAQSRQSTAQALQATIHISNVCVLCPSMHSSMVHTWRVNVLPAGCQHTGGGCGGTDGCAADAAAVGGLADHA